MRGNGTLRALPLVAAISVVPLLVRLRLVGVEGRQMPNFDGWSVYPDLFFWLKSLVLMGLAAACVAFAVASRRAPRDRVFAALCLAFTGTILVSTMASPYSSLAWFGFPTQFEGGLIWIAYLVLAVHAASDSSRAERLLGPYFISASLIAALGILQSYDLDYLNFPILKTLILGGRATGAPVHLNISGGGKIISTLSHGNYVGAYCSLAIPVSLAYFLRASGRLRVLLWFAVQLLLAAVWLACQSKGGLIAGAVGSAFVLFILRKRVWQSWVRLSLLLVCHGLLVFILHVNFGNYETAVTSSYEGWKSALAGHADRAGLFETVSPESVASLGSLKYDGKVLSFHPGAKDSEGVQLRVEKDGVQISDGLGRPVPFELSGREVRLRSEELRDFRILMGRYYFSKVLVLCHRDRCFPLEIGENDHRLRLLYGMQAYELESPARADLPIPDSVFTGRGSIWRLTLPLLSGAWFKGKGFGTYPLEMRINSPVFRSVEKPLILDKPHSLYLQIAFGAGFLGLGLFLALVGRTVARAARRLIRDPDFVHAGIAGAVIGYLVSGVVNDSVVCVAPVFWVFLGLLVPFGES